jgi:hypothetical protein
MTRNGGIAETVTDGPVGDARDREQTVLRYDTSHIQICRSALDLRVQNVRTERRQMSAAKRAHIGTYVLMVLDTERRIWRVQHGSGARGYVRLSSQGR